MRVYYCWKDDLKSLEWYKNNPAEIYLSDQTKVQMLEQYILGRNDSDLDAEAEIKVY